jgi:proteasome lid subunit RPN8/RPN11
VNDRSGVWRVWITDDARENMIKAATSAHPKETGGVLVGVVLGRGRGAGRPWVTHAVDVPSKKRSPNQYQLPSGARQRVVERLRKTNALLGYLGDWHSHTADIDPSPKDADSMASASVTGDSRRPLLFVVRRRVDGYNIDARQWTGAALRRLQIHGSGPLPPADSIARRPQRFLARVRTGRRSAR